jgi:hypothetical protein
VIGDKPGLLIGRDEDEDGEVSRRGGSGRGIIMCMRVGEGQMVTSSYL